MKKKPCWNVLFSVVIFSFCLLADKLSALGHLRKNKVHLINDDGDPLPLPLSQGPSMEDFFWTGSGDGPLPPQRASPPVVTATVLATVFLDRPYPYEPATTPSGEDEGSGCLSECPIQPPDGRISPTRPGHYSPAPDPRYWLLTVLRAPAAPMPPELKKGLARLYRIAFSRQQERHLGIIPTPSVSVRKKHHTELKHLNSTRTSTTNIPNLILNSSEIVLYFANATANIQPSVSATQEISHRSNIGQEIQEIDESSSSKDYENLDGSSRAVLDDDTESFGVEPSPPDVVVRLRRALYSWKDLGVFSMGNVSLDTSLDNSTDIMKREITANGEQPNVEVFLHNMSRDDSSGGPDELRVVYWVSVGGRPVPARTAARDMRLLADSEVVAELGYPITTKAEPYLKTTEAPMSGGVTRASSMRDTWLIVGGAVLAAVLLLALVALLACRLAAGRRKASPTRSPQTCRGDDRDSKLISVVSPSKQRSSSGEGRLVSPRHQPPRPRGRLNRVGSADSSDSTSSGSDLSQMTAALRQRQRLFEQQMQSDYSSVNKRNKSKSRKIRSKRVGISDEAVEYSDVELPRGDGIMQQFLAAGLQPPSPSSSSQDSVVVRQPRGVVSPASYLSMPSVKAFPRGNAVEPLARVLEPLSVRHLDMDSPIRSAPGGSTALHEPTTPPDRQLTRLGSMGRDPGVVGPVVWDRHCQRMQAKEGDSKEGADPGGGNISRMRQRFSELVDDAFSLFGSGAGSPTSPVSSKGSPPARSQLPVQGGPSRRHSARDGELSSPLEPEQLRPHTALPPRPPLPQQMQPPGATTAWGSTSTVPMSRGASADRPRRPTVDVSLVRSDGTLQPSDPALPLLRAIRRELDKLPGTSDA